jgi:hypothetical protein
MMAEWKKLNAAAPVLLANKANTAVPQQTFLLFNFLALTTLWQPTFELAGVLLFAELRAWLNCLFQTPFDKNCYLELNSGLFALQISSFSME